MQLTEHFSLDELCFSSTAVRLGINNTPDPATVQNLGRLAAGLEKVRALLGSQPIHIDSGFRSAALNRAVGGVTHSAHMDGFAADIVCQGFGSPLKIAEAIASSSLDFDQVIQEGTWCHVSFDPKGRREVLTATFGQGGATYRKGL
jgi:hypothetical protein